MPSFDNQITSQQEQNLRHQTEAVVITFLSGPQYPIGIISYNHTELPEAFEEETRCVIKRIKFQMNEYILGGRYLRPVS